MSCTELEVFSSVKVDAYIQRWTICNDDIYLLKFGEEPPEWLEDMVEGIMDDTGLVDSVDDLEDRFSNFEEGYSEHFYDWVDGDKETLAYVSNLYTTNTVFNAGIQEIKVAYVSHNESGAFFDTLIGAWQTGAGGAWFNERVSVVSNVAYSAAKSVSTLTASMDSQYDEMAAIVGDLEVLAKQVDGKVETFTGEHSVVNSDGSIITSAEPYATWVQEGTVAEHTGDTYVQTEKDANGNDAIVGLWGFSYNSNTKEYTWTVITDTLAAEAYQTALDAGVLADGKINTYYQDFEPTIGQDPTLGDGDLWVDSGDDNKLYRYDEANSRWLGIRDKAIQASVDRLDEATVDINGIATAKSSLVVNADGRISGFVASASNDPDYDGSLFQIYADKFYISGSSSSGFSQAPFSITAATADRPANIKFDGYVEFTNTIGSENVLLDGQAAADINDNVTQISGGKIATNTIWVGGKVASSNYNWSGGVVTGFQLSATDTWNIVGGQIYGSMISAGKLQNSVILAEGASVDAGDETGRGSHIELANVTFGSGSYYECRSGYMHGPLYGSGYLKSRISSLSNSTIVVDFTAHWGSTANLSLKLQYSINNGQWNNLMSTTATKPLTRFYEFPYMSDLGTSGYVRFRGIAEGGVPTNGRMDIKVTLIN